VAAFVALVIATVAAFFVTQHLKVTTPFIQGRPAPVPNMINPVDGGVCPRRNGKGVLVPTSYKRMTISFYLQNTSDNVDVWILDHNRQRIRQIGRNVYMRARPPKRHQFSWNGRLANGAVAPAGVYYIQVYLVHQGRSLIISNNTAALPVTVETTRPQVRVTGVTPSTTTAGASAPVTIRYSGTGTLRPRILIYRVRRNAERLVKNYAATTKAGSSRWDATLRGGRPAPPGTYVAAVKLIDKACTTSQSPSAPAAAPRAVVTVR
jgi:flagellar hook capping protein FlgD